MKNTKRPLKRSILAGTILFILLLCIVLSCVQFLSTRKTLYARYESYIGNVLNYTAGEIDTDDLAACIQSGEASPAYRRLQTLLDSLKERLDIHFIYILIPLNTEPADNMQNVIAGATRYEYENEAEELVRLNDLTGDSYSPECAKKYLDAYLSGKLSFFEERSEWGGDYTGLLPLYDSQGKRVAALCIDVDISDIHTTLLDSIAGSLAVIVLLGLGFIVLFTFWIGRNVVKPIELLEAGMTDYAARCSSSKDPETLRIDVPKLRSDNEIGRLTAAVSQMSEAVRNSVKGMVTAEKLAELMRSISSLMDNMPCIAFSKDAETGVYLACNLSFAEYANKEHPKDAVGLTDAELFDAATAAHFAEEDRTALSQDEPYVYCEDVSDAAGRERQLQTTKLKFIDETGRLCLLGMSVDVTELLRVEQENVRNKEAYEKAKSTGIIYSHIAQTLARGYTDVFYVNLETEEFIEYRIDDERGTLTEARRGQSFFASCRQEALLYVHPDDWEAFLSALDRTSLTDALDRSRTFLMTYRLVTESGFSYVSMKISRLEDDERFIIIGIADIDEQMKQRRAAERMEEERITYARIAALTGDYLCIYSVNAETGQYREYNSTPAFESLALAKQGDDFFTVAREKGRSFVHPEDLARYLSLFTRENVLSQIGRSDIFTMSYRMIIEGKPMYVRLKAAMVEEKDGPRLVVGINDIDYQVRQEADYARRLAQAQILASVDALTGVRNRHAYLETEEELNRKIAENRQPEFAIVILDVNDLKKINDSTGHQAGDAYLRSACKIICDIFKHSPVFRIGGDEFAVIAQGSDLARIEALLAQIDAHNAEALRTGGIVLACGMAEFRNDASVAPVFERADQRMYENKTKLKACSGDS